MSVAIKVENLSKAYQIGEVGTAHFTRSGKRWFSKYCQDKTDLLNN